MNAEELGGEDAVQGEDVKHPLPPGITFSIPITPREKSLTYEVASNCLHTLGRDETGARYAYIALSVIDRQLTSIEVITKFKHLQFVDVSKNYLSSNALEVIAKMPFIVSAILSQNRIESLAKLEPVIQHLQVLDVSGNRVKDTTELQPQPLLANLNLANNEINILELVGYEQEFQQLDISGNKIFKLSGTYPKRLQTLYAASNQIIYMGDITSTSFPNLRVLHLRDNHLNNLKGLCELPNLEYLNLRNNPLSGFKVLLELQELRKLNTLIVLGCVKIVGSAAEVMKGEGGGGDAGEGGDVEKDSSKIRILAILPQLKRVNKSVIGVGDRAEAEQIRDVWLRAIQAAEEDDVNLDDISNLDDEEKVLLFENSTNDDEEEDDG